MEDTNPSTTTQPNGEHVEEEDESALTPSKSSDTDCKWYQGLKEPSLQKKHIVSIAMTKY